MGNGLAATAEEALVDSLMHHHPRGESEFWSSILDCAPPRDRIVANPRGLDCLAHAHSHNLVNLSLACVQYCKLLAEDDSGRPLSAVNLDRLSWSLSLYLTSLQVLIFDCELYHLLFKLDRGVAAQYSQVNPILDHFLEFAKEKKKAKIERHRALALAALPPDEPKVEPPPRPLTRTRPRRSRRGTEKAGQGFCEESEKADERKAEKVARTACPDCFVTEKQGENPTDRSSSAGSRPAANRQKITSRTGRHH
jgi:hypothetical protein